MIVTGSSAASSHTAVALSRQHPGMLFATAGVHPHHATEMTAAVLAELGALTAAPQVVAVGECGLDYYRNYSPHAAQREAFQRQLELAAALRQARVPAPARRPRRFHRHAARALAGARRRRGALLHRRRRASSSVISTSGSPSASPAGSATSAAARTCSSSCGASPPTACSSRPMDPTCCRGTCSPSQPRAATSRCILRTSPPWWPAPAASRSRQLARAEHAGCAQAVPPSCDLF